MHPLEGIAISPGYAEGVAVVYDYETDYRLEFPDRDISASEIGAEHRLSRLNFEFNVECYDRDLAMSLTDLAQSKIRRSQPLTLADVDKRGLPRRLRDGVARLFPPYL